MFIQFVSSSLPHQVSQRAHWDESLWTSDLGMYKELGTSLIYAEQARSTKQTPAWVCTAESSSHAKSNMKPDGRDTMAKGKCSGPINWQLDWRNLSTPSALPQGGQQTGRWTVICRQLSMDINGLIYRSIQWPREKQVSHKVRSQEKFRIDV